MTGATGSVGRHLVTTLADAGETVRAGSRKPQEAALPDGVEVVRAAFAEPSTLSREVFDGVMLSSLAATNGFPRDLGSASYTDHVGG